MVEMSDLDEEAAVNDHSALTLSRGNDAAIHTEQISCGGKEGRTEEEMHREKEGETNSRVKTNIQRIVTMMLNFNPAEVMMLLVGPQLQIRRLNERTRKDDDGRTKEKREGKEIKSNNSKRKQENNKSDE